VEYSERECNVVRSKCNHVHPDVLKMQCSFQSFGFDPLLTQTEKTEQLPSADTHKNESNFCLHEVTAQQLQGGGVGSSTAKTSLVL